MLEATKAVFVRFRALLEIRQIWLVWARKQKRFNFANLTQLNTKKIVNTDYAAIPLIMVLNASFLSLLANSGLFWVPMSKTARQELLGWDGARAAGLAWGGDWGGGGVGPRWAEGGGIWVGKGRRNMGAVCLLSATGGWGGARWG